MLDLQKAKVTLLGTAGESGWQFTRWINDTSQGQVLTDYAPHMQPGEKHAANFFTPGDMIIHWFLSHI